MVSLSGKALLAVLPYFLSATEFNQFNSKYYVLSLVTIIGGLGFDYSYQRSNISLKKLSLWVVLNVIVMLNFVVLSGYLQYDFPIIILLLVGSASTILVNITSFTIIYQKKIRNYILIQAVFNGFVLILFPIIYYFYNSAFIAFITLKVIAFILVFRFVVANINNSSGATLGLYKYGINALVINGFLTVILSSNHILAGKILDLESANNIVLAWLASMPLLYLSTISEKVLFNSSQLRYNIFKWYKLNVGLSLLYVISLLIVVTFFHNLLPQTVSVIYFKSFLHFTIPILFLYSISNPIMNFIVYKKLNYKKQIGITISSTILIFLFFFIGINSINGNLKLNSITLLVLTNSIIFAGMLVKGIIIYRGLNSIGYGKIFSSKYNFLEHS